MAKSRYETCSPIVYKDGEQVIQYRQRRFLPKEEEQNIRAETTVRDGERLDLLAHRLVGHSLFYWKVADANTTMNPFDLVASPGNAVKVPGS